MGLKLIIVNQFDAATLTSDNTPEAELPLSNMQRSGRSEFMRYVGNNINIYGNLDNGSAAADGWKLYHDCSLAGIVRLRLYSGENQGGSVVYDSNSGGASLGTVPLWDGVNTYGSFLYGGDVSATEGLPKATGAWFGAQTYRSFLLEVDDAGSTKIDLSRLYIGSRFAPSVNMNWNRVIAEIDDSRHERAADGSIVTIPEETFRRATIQLAWLSDEESTELFKQFTKVKKKGDIYLSLDSDETDERTRLTGEMLCRRNTNAEQVHAALNTNTQAIVLDEV